MICTGSALHSLYSTFLYLATVFWWSALSTVTYTAMRDQTKHLSFIEWKNHHCFLLVTTLHHHLHYNTESNKTSQSHWVKKSPLLSAGYYSSSSQHMIKQNISVSSSEKSPLLSAGYHSSSSVTRQHRIKQDTSVSPCGKFSPAFLLVVATTELATHDQWKFLFHRLENSPLLWAHHHLYYHLHCSAGSNNIFQPHLVEKITITTFCQLPLFTVIYTAIQDQ